MPQEVRSLQVRVWLLFVHALHSPHDQFSVQATEQLCVNGGRLVVVPQLLLSVQVRLCELFAHVPHALQVQVSVQTGMLHPCVKAGRFVVVPQEFASVQVRDCTLFAQVDQAPHDQLSVHCWADGCQAPIAVPSEAANRAGEVAPNEKSPLAALVKSGLPSIEALSSGEAADFQPANEDPFGVN